MGMFNVKVKVANLSAPAKEAEVELLVDSGATLSWIPREVLERLGLSPQSRLPYSLADGRTFERDVTSVLLAIDGRRAPVPVAFGEIGEESVLPVTALEILGLNPVAQKLVPLNLYALTQRIAPI